MVGRPTEADIGQATSISSRNLGDNSLNEVRVTQQVISNIAETVIKTRDNEEITCPICLLEYVDSEHEVSIFNCGHKVHRKCIDLFISQKDKNCPSCLKEVKRNEDETI